MLPLDLLGTGAMLTDGLNLPYDRTWTVLFVPFHLHQRFNKRNKGREVHTYLFWNLSLSFVKGQSAVQYRIPMSRVTVRMQVECQVCEGHNDGWVSSRSLGNFP